MSKFTIGFLVVIVLLCSFFSFGQRKYLHDNWLFFYPQKNTWFKANVPGTIHTDLLKNKLIPEPFYQDNENKLQWISKQVWTYKNRFQYQAPAQDTVYIVFEGLDTYADVWLNEKHILSAHNMFTAYTVPIATSFFKKNNELKITFYSNENIADSIAQTSILKYPCENNRNRIRKAQYHFGWDFAPRFITQGIWRNIYITHKKESFANAQYSDYTFHSEDDSIGKSFYFKKNGKPIFMSGANWVPADVFLPNIKKEKYRKLLLYAHEAGIKILRVWGGGIYEDDYFYTLCDSLGIAVWQDFMFAGAMYAADTAMLQNIKEEATYQIQRLRKYKCIVLWCGNNEIDEAWHNWGWQKQFAINENDSIKLWESYKKIFHELLPSLVKKYDSARPYIASSPLYGWGKTKSMTHGDSHYWGMWWGLQPINIMQQKIPRFMSEYGMQAMPHINTLKEICGYIATDTNDNYLRTHQKHPTGFANLNTYLQLENYNIDNIQEYIESTQTLQDKAIQTALSTHIQASPYCMGSLLWQFNDCWPAISWSIIDYYGNKKKAFYTVQKLNRKIYDKKQ